MKTLNDTQAPSLFGYDDLPYLISLQTGDEKHEASAHSTLDVLWVLYDRILDASPGRLDDPLRDRLYVSKGHGPMAYYAVLAAKGFFPVSWLETFGSYDSPLGGHPDRMLIPGVEISSGSLGHGLGMAVGASLALRARNLASPRVFCLMGDGELGEGSNHEAIAVAARLGLDALTAVLIDNQTDSLGWPAGPAERFAVERWRVTAVDGRDHVALTAALSKRPSDAPHVVVAEIGGNR